MERTATYDYKWRHREATNLFPAQLLKLDTSVPPYGRVLRAQHLAFLALANREEPWESKEEKRARRAKVLAQMALEQGAAGADDTSVAAAGARAEVGKRGVAIVIPARFNGNTSAQTQAHPVPLPFAAEPVPDPEDQHGSPSVRQRALDSVAPHRPLPSQPVSVSSSGVASPVLPSASSLHVSGGSSGAGSGASSSAASPGAIGARKLLSPSKSQVRRESMGSAAMGALLAGDAAAGSRSPTASATAPLPQLPPPRLSEDELREQRERQWAAEEAAQAAEEAAEARARQLELEQLAAAREAHALQQQQQTAQPKQLPA